jgi:hypothetical protein
MSDNTERRFVYLGTFSDGGLPDVFEIPTEALQKVEANLDAARAKREAEAAKARAAVLGAARAQGRLKRARHAVFRRRISR